MRVVLDHQLDSLGQLTTGEPLRDRQRDVDARGDATSGDPVAVRDDALIDRERPEQRKEIHERPVGGGAIAAK